MPSLREFQESFLNAIRASDAGDFAQWVAASELTGDQRINVYRNNHLLSLTDALRAVYPVLERLVGDGFFRYLAHEYIARYPSRCGNLHDFGREMPEFLGHFEPASTYVYLPDVASLEWLRDEAFHAAEARPFDFSTLAEVPADSYAQLRFSLHPSVRWMRSRYPVLNIWRANQDEVADDEHVNLDQGAQCVLVTREDLRVAMREAAQGECSWLDAIQAGVPFVDACEAAQVADPDFDAGAALAGFVTEGVVVGFQRS